MKRISLGLIALFVSVSANAMDCLDHGSAIGVSNVSVLKWKRSTPNQFLARANVAGKIVAVGPMDPGHLRVVISLNSIQQSTDYCKGDFLEVIYNREFGDVAAADLTVGSTVNACGDYKTSFEPTKQYPASPACAIIHWIHKNVRGDGHENGFLIINGHMYGQQTPVAGKQAVSGRSFQK